MEETSREVQGHKALEHASVVRMTNPVKYTVPAVKKLNQLTITAESRADFMSVSNQFFASYLAEKIDVGREVLSFQKNIFKKQFYIKLRSESAVKELCLRQRVTIKGRNFTIQSCSDNSFWITVHWANTDLPDETITTGLAPYGEVLHMMRPRYETGPLKGVEMGTRRIKFDPKNGKKYVPNFIQFNEDTVMFTYPGMTPECRRCAQDDHKFHECQSIYCENCQGFTPHCNPHTTQECPEACHQCHSYDHTISWCRRKASYASTLRDRQTEPIREVVEESNADDGMWYFSSNRDPLDLEKTQSEASDDNQSVQSEEDCASKLEKVAPTSVSEPTNKDMLAKVAEVLVSKVLSVSEKIIHSEQEGEVSEAESFVTVEGESQRNRLQDVEHLSDSSDSASVSHEIGGEMEVAPADTSPAREKNNSNVPETPELVNNPISEETLSKRLKPKVDKRRPQGKTVVQEAITDAKPKDRGKPY